MSVMTPFKTFLYTFFLILEKEIHNQITEKNNTTLILIRQHGGMTDLSKSNPLDIQVHLSLFGR